MRVQHRLQRESVLGRVCRDIDGAIEGCIASHAMAHDTDSLPVNMRQSFVKRGIGFRPLNCVQHVLPMVVIALPSTGRRRNNHYAQAGHRLNQVWNHLATHSMSIRDNGEWSLREVGGMPNRCLCLSLPTKESTQVVTSLLHGKGACRSGGASASHQQSRLHDACHVSTDTVNGCYNLKA